MRYQRTTCRRARAFVETVALDAELRNRNPLHPSATPRRVGHRNTTRLPEAVIRVPLRLLRYGWQGKSLVVSVCLQIEDWYETDCREMNTMPL